MLNTNFLKCISLLMCSVQLHATETSTAIDALNKQHYDAAVKYFDAQLGQGEAVAQYKLALSYYQENTPLYDLTKAMYWFTQSANRNYAPAKYYLAHLYGRGVGARDKSEDAERLLREAAEQGYADAQYELALSYTGDIESSNDLLMLKWMQKAAAQNHLRAQDFLAAWFSDKGGRYYKPTEAFRLNLALAQQGDAVAQRNIGMFYYKGEGVRQNHQKAFSWLQKAALQGDIGAQCRLADMYRNGDGLSQDYHAAYTWYAKAAEQRSEEAQYRLGLLFEYGQGIPRDYQEAAHWYQMAAQEGNSLAQNNLGRLLLKGLGVNIDYVQAHMWFALAALSGLQDAEHNLRYVESIMTTDQITAAKTKAELWDAEHER